MKVIFKGYKKCERCKQFYTPGRITSRYCPYCSGLSNKYKPKKKCKIDGCDSLIGNSSRYGLCKKHYMTLIYNPRQRYLYALDKVGVKICKNYTNCDIYFKPRNKYEWSRRELCDKCQQKKYRRILD